METIILGGGCFWCTEAIFIRLNGINEVIPGYAGGEMENPSYEQISRGNTGHAESIKLVFDPSIISLDQILDVFFETHDATTLNRQGADVGTQYRSVIFYMNEDQKKTAEAKIQQIQKDLEAPVVTELIPFKNFYTAEEYHFRYYDKNPANPYCSVVISPKIRKLFGQYPGLVKESS